MINIEFLYNGKSYSCLYNGRKYIKNKTGVPILGRTGNKEGLILKIKKDILGKRTRTFFETDFPEQDKKYFIDNLN